MKTSTPYTAAAAGGARRRSSRWVHAAATLLFTAQLAVPACDTDLRLPPEGSSETDCTNGMDDDLDGQVDCADRGCLPACEDKIKGVCCLSSGGCEVGLQMDCASSTGTYMGNGTTCSVNPCPVREGACCLATDCNVRTQEECTQLGGVFKGHNTDCAGSPCAATTGACCDGVGTCVDRTESDCLSLSGTYLGDGTFCSGPCF